MELGVHRFWWHEQFHGITCHSMELQVRKFRYCRRCTLLYTQSLLQRCLYHLIIDCACKYINIKLVTNFTFAVDFILSFVRLIPGPNPRLSFMRHDWCLIQCIVAKDNRGCRSKCCWTFGTQSYANQSERKKRRQRYNAYSICWRWAAAVEMTMG